MLVGPPVKPSLPEIPREQDGIRGVIQYLKDLEISINAFVSAIVTNSVALAGLRGVSTTGIVPKNFSIQSLAFGGRTTALWAFDAAESDPSFMLIISPNSTASFALVNIVRQTTGVIFQIAQTGIAGLSADILLLR